MTRDAEAGTVVLCAGSIDYRELPVSGSETNAMVPVNGKPVIAWILDDLHRKKIHAAVMVVKRGDRALREFLVRGYLRKMDIDLVDAPLNGTILDSLKAGVERLPALGVTRIVLGDTLITDGFDGEDDFVYIGEVSYSRRWCLVRTTLGEQITEYIDKKELSPGHHHALAGFYHLRDRPLLLESLRNGLDAGERELSHLLRRYGDKRPIRAVVAQQWFDFGHMDKLVEARMALIRSRDFNSLTVDPVLGTITKVSQHDEKLRDELHWYLEVPESLKVLTPRIIGKEETDGRIRVTQEYYGYPTLAELYLYGQLSVEVWDSILRRLFQIHDACRSEKGALSPEHIRNMYEHKTFQRLNELEKQDATWHGLLRAPRLTLNGRRLRGVDFLRTFICERSEHLTQTAEVAVIHGDFCFSNILFDLGNQIVRLVDPRGRFGKKGVYGDPRYDIAKLRHSVHGLYDFIVADLFDIEQTGLDFAATIHAPEMAAVGEIFDGLLTQAGYDIDDIMLIEGLLFLSMVPLHVGHMQRQLLMYLTGLELLNDVYENRQVMKIEGKTSHADCR